MGRISDALRKLYDNGENRDKKNIVSKSKSESASVEENSEDSQLRESNEGEISDTKSCNLKKRRSDRDSKFDPSVVYPKVFFGKVSHKLFMYYQSSIALMEEMRHIASSIVGLDDTLFLVTSAQPGEGKTVVSLNLAMAISNSLDKNVLYIDADMRAVASSLSFLDLPERKLSGFTDVLFEDVDLKSAIVGTEVNGLFIMPRGKKRPLERIGYKKLKWLMDTVREQFDIVLIDTAPVRIFSDPRLLSGVVDAALLVVKMNATPRGSVKHAVQLLKDARAKRIYFILNAVMNYMPGKNVNSKYYSYYVKQR